LATLIDIRKCVGCEACVEACREANDYKFHEPQKSFPKMYPSQSNRALKMCRQLGRARKCSKVHRIVTEGEYFHIRRQFTEQKRAKPIYLVLIFMTELTGFGQMPIFKRYYIADVPGLACTAEFYVTHYLHYIGSMMLVMLFVYVIVFYFGLMRFRRLPGDNPH
jgi:hypothetical protein